MKLLLQIFLTLLVLTISPRLWSQANDANKYFEEGEAAFAKQDYQAAVTAYSKAIQLMPKTIKYYSARATAKRQINDDPGAAADYSKIIELNPSHAGAYLDRADLKAYSLNDKYGAVADYRKAIELNPKNAIKAYFDICAVEQYFIKDYDAALADYNKLLAIAPNDANAYQYRGGVKVKLKDYSGALTDLNKAIRLKPKDPYVYRDRGELKIIQKDWKAALTDYQKAAELDPTKADNYSTIAFIKAVGLQDYDGAMSAISKAIEIDPKISLLFSTRGMINEYFGKYAEAVKDLETSMVIDKTNSINYVAIIKSLARMRKFSESAEYYSTYQTLGLKSFIDDSSGTYFKNYIEAITNGITKNDYNTALMHLQQAEMLSDNKQGTDNEFKKLNLTSTLALKGYVLEKLDRNAEARDAYKQGIVINPNQADVLDALAELEKKMAAIIKSDNTPPTIELIRPEATRSFDIESDNEKIQIVGKARDNSGIALVKINGQVIDKVEEDGLFLSDLFLEAGANKIDITATDKKGNTASRSFIINGATVAKKNVKEVNIPTFTNQQPKYYAILIAENEYQDPGIKDLENPVKDASDLKEILESYYTFNKENIDTVYNKSRDEIMEAIIQRCNTLTENDNLIIFYAGHGWGTKDQFGNTDGYLIPVSARKKVISTYISANDINTSLKSSKAKHILVIADACFSGALTRDIGGDAGKVIRKQYEVSSRKVMASGNMEPVPDNSIFIHYLKKNLKANTEKYMTANNLFNGFKEAVINNSDTLPQYAAIKNVGDEGGEFVFIKK